MATSWEALLRNTRTVMRSRSAEDEPAEAPPADEAAGVPDEEPAQPASIPAASAKVRAALIMRFIFFMLLSSICNENTV